MCVATYGKDRWIPQCCLPGCRLLIRVQVQAYTETLLRVAALQQLLNTCPSQTACAAFMSPLTAAVQALQPSGQVSVQQRRNPVVPPPSPCLTSVSFMNLLLCTALTNTMRSLNTERSSRRHID